MAEKIIDFQFIQNKTRKKTRKPKTKTTSFKTWNHNAILAQGCWKGRWQKVKKSKTLLEKEAIEDLVFLKSLKTDRTAQYATKKKKKIPL